MIVSLSNCIAIEMDWHSSLSIVTSYELDDRRIGDRFPAMTEMFLFSTATRPSLEHTQTLIQWVLGTLSPMVQRPGREDDHSPSSSEPYLHYLTRHLVVVLN
jgi:hypothetical protein